MGLYADKLLILTISFLVINILFTPITTTQQNFKPHITVAADGSGDFTTISEAITAATNNSVEPFVIFVKRGRYIEHLKVGKEKKNIHLIGEGMGVTVISGFHSNATGYRTYDSATVGMVSLSVCTAIVKMLIELRLFQM